MTKNDLDVLKNYDLTLSYAEQCGITVETSEHCILMYDDCDELNRMITSTSFSEAVEFLKGYAFALEIELDQ